MMKVPSFIRFMIKTLRDQRGEVGVDINATAGGTEGAAAVSETATAEGQGAQDGTTGTAAAQPAAESTLSGAATEGGTEGNTADSPDKGEHQTTAPERADQLKSEITDLAAEKARIKQEILDEINQTVQTGLQQKLEPLPFKEYDLEQVNSAFAATRDRIEEMRLAGDYIGAERLQKKLYAAIDEYEANETAKEKWQQEQQQNDQQQQFYQMIDRAVAEAEPLLKQKFNVPEQAWQDGKKFFDAARKADPFLNRKYQEMLVHQGPAQALEYAFNYCKENMGKEAQTEIQKREDAKQNLPPSPSGNALPDLAGIETQLKAAQKKASETGQIDDMAEVSRLKRQLKAAQATTT